jgi:hypothetical protein
LIFASRTEGSREEKANLLEEARMSILPRPAYGDASALEPARPRKRYSRSATAVRLRVVVGRDALDTALARGADRTRRPELAIRAAQLERRRHRRALARTLRRVVAEARGPRPPVRATAVIIARGQIAADGDEVLALADRLDSFKPAQAAGIAIAQRLVTDAMRSPLYVSSEPGTLKRLAQQAVVNMENPAEQLLALTAAAAPGTP